MSDLSRERLIYIIVFNWATGGKIVDQKRTTATAKQVLRTPNIHDGVHPG
jgi:hypothetical protein